MAAIKNVLHVADMDARLQDLFHRMSSKMKIRKSRGSFSAAVHRTLYEISSRI